MISFPHSVESSPRVLGKILFLGSFNNIYSLFLALKKLAAEINYLMILTTIIKIRKPD